MNTKRITIMDDYAFMYSAFDYATYRIVAYAEPDGFSVYHVFIPHAEATQDIHNCVLYKFYSNHESFGDILI